MQKKLKYLATLAALIFTTLWQYRAGLSRCGSIDGGILAAPLLVFGYLAVKDSAKETIKVYKEVFNYDTKKHYRA